MRLKRPAKRLSLNLSETAHAEVNALAEETDRSITELIRLGLSFIRIVFQEHQQGNRIIVTTSDGKHLKELVIPGI